MVGLGEIREFHVVMVAVQIALAFFTVTTGVINIGYGQVASGLLGLFATPVLLYLAYRHHKKLRSIER